MSARVAILGGGLQGTSVALELAERGVAVDLYERDGALLGRASLRNEGKIHLGFVYAKDESLATARLMLDGALSFGPLLSRWTRGAIDKFTLSRPFDYVVPADSLCAPADLERHYEQVQSLYEERRAAGAGGYLGSVPARLFDGPAPESRTACLNRDRVQAVYSTAELAVDLPSLCAQVGACVDRREKVRVHCNHTVRCITRTADGFRVEGRRGGRVGEPERFEEHYEQVVNALWDGRLVLDEQLGLLPRRAWVHRLKYRVLVDLPESLRGMPSLTFVLGPYGDLVTYERGPTYVSWYPTCMRGWSDAVAPPTNWDAACRGVLGDAERRAIGSEALAAFDALVPGISESKIRTVDAGTIFAWGASDIDQEQSELHARNEIGVRSHDGYHTVDTGKLTTAPLFAVHTADRVCGTTVL